MMSYLASVLNTIRILIVVASGAFCLFSTTFSFADSTTGRIPEARYAFVECINTVFPKLADIPGLTPVGVAYFVGLSCSEKREAYVNALKESSNSNTAGYIEKIDFIVVTEVLKRVKFMNQNISNKAIKLPAN